MKHEYTGDELAELKKIYDESGEAGLQIGEMRALRKAGLLTPDLPPEQERMRTSWPTIRPSASPRRNRRNRRNVTSSSRIAETASTKANRSTARKPPKRSA